jgi:DNA-binding LacI/PurR family transcriptional regulator
MWGRLNRPHIHPEPHFADGGQALQLQLTLDKMAKMRDNGSASKIQAFPPSLCHWRQALPATIYDVAEYAGVGIGTVSRVLNESPSVRSETRQRVIEAIETLNYRPSPIARRLSLRKTLAIGVVVPFLTRPSVVERLRGIEAVVAESDYDLIVYNVETPARRDAYFLNIPPSNRVDGLIVISLRPSDEDILQWRSSAIPIILVDCNHPALHRVVIDDVAGGYLATAHLIELGHHRIAFAGDPEETLFHFSSSHDRFLGYRQALADHGLSFDPTFYQTGEHGRAPARDITLRLLSLEDPPTAVFAASDTQALGVIEAARSVGLQIPGDLSVVGFDDVEVAEFLNLTTVRQPLLESGRRGIELLLRAIDDPAMELVCDQLPLELVVRETTSPPHS